MVRVLVASDTKRFQNKAAELFIEAANISIQRRNQFTVALSGGTTPGPVYALLGDPAFQNRVDWGKIFLFWVDERCVPKDHPDSNYGLVANTLLSKVSLEDHHIFRVQTDIGPVEQVAEDYENRLRQFFGRSPGFDFVYLGLGDDGHTASLFPHSAILNEKGKWVSSYYFQARDSYRITLTYPIINASDRIVFLCQGQSKAKIMGKVLENRSGNDLIQETPAMGVQTEQGEMIWLLDKPAASDLPDSVHYEEV